MTWKTMAFAAVTIAVTATATPLAAQSAAEWVTKGNEAWDVRNAPEALKAYEAALAADPKSYEALWRAARAGVELGEFDGDKAHRTGVFQTAVTRARAAVQLNPGDAWAHFALAQALGRTAQSLGVSERVKYGVEVHDEAAACLKIDPKHAGCLHVIGVWNAEIMRLNGFQRMMAKSFLGGKIFGLANWPAAQQYLIDAISNDPRRIVHRLDLARVYADRGMPEKARSQYQIAIDGPLIDYNDPHYKDQARAELKKL